MVTHDVMAASYCDRILFMKDGEIKAALNREQENKQTFFTDIFRGSFIWHIHYILPADPHRPIRWLIYRGD